MSMEPHLGFEEVHPYVRVSLIRYLNMCALLGMCVHTQKEVYVSLYSVCANLCTCVRKYVCRAGRQTDRQTDRQTER